MAKTNYYGIILSNGYLEAVYTTKQEAETYATKINNGDYSGPDYKTYSAQVVKGLQNIQTATRRKFSEKDIKERLN